MLVASAVTSIPTLARAACAADPDDISFKQMIRRGTTNDDYFHRMIIGRVVTIRDPGDEGGDAVAVVAVGAHPTGFVPLVARVHFYKPPPGTGISENIEYAPGERWVIIARHKHDGSYAHDGGCGQTRRLTTDRFRQLTRLAQKYD